MKELVVQLYNEIYENKIKNRVDSQYWIYNIENLIIRENGLSKRYLKVLFFNRYFNENNNLMRLYLKINGELVEQDLFKTVSAYGEASVMGFTREIDLIEEGKEIEIIGYIKDGKKVELSEEYATLFRVETDEERKHLLELYYYHGNKKVLLVPQISEEYWLCSCGNYNADSIVICPVCATKKEEIQAIAEIDYKELILKNINHVIKPSLDQSLLETIDEYVKKFCIRYKFTEEEIVNSIDKSFLQRKFDELKNNTIEEYLQNHPIEHFRFTKEKSLDENVMDYVRPVLKSGVISFDDVKSKMDIATFAEKYANSNVSSNKSYTKVWLIAGGIILGILALSFIINSVSEPQRMETCRENGDIWIDGECKSFEDIDWD